MGNVFRRKRAPVKRRTSFVRLGVSILMVGTLMLGCGRKDAPSVEPPQRPGIGKVEKNTEKDSKGPKIIIEFPPMPTSSNKDVCEVLDEEIHLRRIVAKQDCENGNRKACEDVDYNMHDLKADLRKELKDPRNSALKLLLDSIDECIGQT